MNNHKTSAAPVTGPFHASASGNIWLRCSPVAVGCRREDEFFQQCATGEGAKALADLLNRAVTLVGKMGPMIVSDDRRRDEVVASALARAFGWRLELPAERDVRIREEMAEALRP
jgi:hypothetical protein